MIKRVYSASIRNAEMFIGGDLVQVLRGRGRRISAENFFLLSPKNAKFFPWGGRRRTHCFLETNVG